MADRSLLLVCWLAGLLAAAPIGGQGQGAGPVSGLDHVPLAVRNLDRAIQTFRRLGFAIKPGRPHANGIRNAHVKFTDGTGIGLITAETPVDALTRRYVEFLLDGGGPAFLALRAPDTGRLGAALRHGGYAFDRDGEVTDLRDPPLGFLFFVRDRRSPTDRPEHFAHPNGAAALGAVWVATDSEAELERFLTRLGGSSVRRTVQVPQEASATVVSFAAGDVIILPASHRIVANRPVMGLSIRSRSLDAVGRQLSEAGIASRVAGSAPRRLVVPPRETCGIWLEFQ